MIITFTITNNQPPAVVPQLSETDTLTDTLAALQAVEAGPDPNLVQNVLLVESLTEYAAFASAFPRPDHRGNEYVWNLGDLRPLASITVTLVLTAPENVAEVVALDEGARAWGTLQGWAISAAACPVTLAPDALAPYLQATVDADLYDEYVARRAGQLCQPTRTFEYARTLGYEVYYGSLRGARGTEWSQAGNSLDQSNLLVAMLRGNGTPTRYRHGTLSTERAQELILSMFPLTGAVVGYVPDGAEVSDPAHDPRLLAEAEDHWWVEAYLDGNWVAMDPSFKYAELGQTFAAPTEPPLDEVPDELRHKVTITIETERYHMLNYLHGGFDYETQFTYTLDTAELVGEPLTLEHLVARQTPPFGCLFFCWTHYTYVPYLRLGDNVTLIEGEPFWELLSNFPFGQSAITAEWVHFDLRDAEGNVTRYTRQIADRVSAGPRGGPLREPKMIKGLMTADVLSSLGPGNPSLMSQLDSHTIYFNPSWMSPGYAAHVADDLLVAMPRIARLQSVAMGLGEALGGGRPEFVGVELVEVAELVDGTIQAFNHVLGASYVIMSDWAAQDLAETGLVRSYPDAPRITIASSVISPSTEETQTEAFYIMDLLNDSVRVIAYPGQAKGTEPLYRMTRGVSDTFLEAAVGEELTGERSASAANILQAALNQNIPLAYVDAGRLDVLARLEISTQSKAFILDAVQQGHVVLAPERPVEWHGEQRVAWWQLDPETGEMVGVGEDGTHQCLIMGAVWLAVNIIMVLSLVRLIITLVRMIVWLQAANMTWEYFYRKASAGLVRAEGEGKSLREVYQEALSNTKAHMQTIGQQYPEFVR